MASRGSKRPRLRPPASARSRFALNAVNFFLAELSGIGSPYLSDFLHDHGWSDASVGLAASMPGLGIFLVLPAAGFFLDRARPKRLILAAAAIAVGACYALLPSIAGAPHAVVDAVFFASGLAQAFFAPLIAGLALGLVGRGHLDRTMGSNQASNHLGDVAAAIVAIFVVRTGIGHVFYVVAVIAVLAAFFALVIRRDELDHDRARGGTGRRAPFRALLEDRRVLILIASTGLFQMAYASTLPFVVVRVRDLGGPDELVAAIVLVSQAAMAPVAILAGRHLHHAPHKPLFALAFVNLPVFILACAFVHSVVALVALQALGSVSAGIFGVAIVTFCADLTQGTGNFHALMGTANAAFAAGAVVGPAATGFLVERFGHELGFLALSLVAVAAALLFLREMPETRMAAAPRGVCNRASSP